MNKIILIGNLGKEPDMSYTPSGKAVTKFSLAVNRRSRDPETGERRDETQWFNIVAWDRLAETCNSYLHKGSKVMIEGRMTSHDFTDKEGIKRTFWDVIATDMEFVEPKGATSGPSDNGGRDTGPDDLPF